MKNEENCISYHMIITGGEFAEMKTMLAIAPWTKLNLESDEIEVNEEIKRNKKLKRNEKIKK